jgi:ribosomal protein L29
MSDIPNFAKLVPGFDFLQGLVKNAGSALPNIGQWVAPTLSPEELQKRIDELKTVQFWLEQNAKMLGTTIQALEVQRMTLSTLRTMNVQMTDLRDAMKAAPIASAGSAASAAAGSVANSFGADALMQAARNAMGGLGGAVKPAAEPALAPEPAPAPKARPKAAAAETPAVGASGVVDPMQWWGALTKQFTQLAATAMKDSATDAAKSLAGAMMKQGMDAAGETIKKAVAMPAGVAAKAMSAATQAANATGAKAVAKKSDKSAAAKKAPAGKTPVRKTTPRAAKPRAS